MNKYYFINNFDTNIINKQDDKTIIIYRNYTSKKIDEKLILKIKNYCKKKLLKFYISNEVKLAVKLNLDGVYIPSFNKNFSHLSFSYKKNFEIIGSAHNTKEIIQKENQGCTKIFLCPIFKTKKNKYFLGVTVFNLTKLHAKKDIIPLGGINDKNIKKINLCRVKSVAGISWIKKNGPSINTGPFKF